MTPYARIACTIGLGAALQAYGAAPQGGEQPADAAGAGQQIAAKGASGAAPCSSCHGQQGEGNAASGFPRLAGQSRDYLAHQLDSYADGSRKNEVMAPIAKALNAEQRKAVSAYYEQLTTGEKRASASASKKTVSAPRLATVGDSKLRVQACANCHGPGGIGEPPGFPYLASQHASYLASALREWKSGARNNDPTAQMPSIAKALSDADIKSLSDYYARLPAPPGAQQLLSMKPAAPGAASPASSAAGPKQATPTTGAGVEPGTSTQGGAQGPGGGGAASGTGPQGGNR